MSQNKQNYLVVDDTTERPLSDLQKQHLQNRESDEEVQQKLKEFENQMDTEFK
ncbi:hypothetical protein [Lapidilactobacillus luobeiensis]|uniref:hypothetical protein n=1 Tax=Lapidilactobacillus luobeiensis TaxID=2950371 RepID=UPI0021C299A2|nr:hypothetical protein [Lapidilactobacillus luobeiensis]